MSVPPAYIPATQRPDGTWRKPRRVRPGYVPPEELDVYESDGRRFERERLAMGVVGNIPKETPKSKSLAQKPKQKKIAQKKDTKPKQNKKQEPKQPPPTAKSKVQEPQEFDPSKQQRKLQKKLREIERLQEQQASGVEINAEQKEKLSRKSELEKELQSLSL
eukprot:gene8943-1281_t